MKIITSNFSSIIRKTILNAKTLLLGFIFLSIWGTAQQSYTFTTANVRGRVGPNQTQLNSAYLTTNLNGLVVSTTPTSGVQQYTIVNTGLYAIDAYGAEGGTSISNFRVGGYGARMRGEFNFTAGTVLRVLVGQMTSSVYAAGDQFQAGGGGGGSFVWISTGTVPLVVAGGGGGGGANQGTSYNGVPGQTTTAGAASTGSYTSAGGTLGSGGAEFTGQGGHAHGGSAGAGWLSDGASVLSSAVGGYNIFYNGGFGGQNGAIGGNSYGSDGGFGGGGGGVIGGGGGGGYSGGGAGNQPINGSWFENGGGGGGSYNSGTNQLSSVGTNTGSGKVILSELCFINIAASTPIPTVPVICAGTTVTLTTNAVSNYTWSNGNTTNTSIVVTPATTTTYSVIGTSSANCVASSIITITVSAGVPVLSISTSTPNLCLGKSATLTASGALTYTWTGGISNGVGFIPNATTSYTVSGQNGCGTTSAVTTITVAPLPVTAIVTPTSVCAGSTATLTAASAVTGYTWSPGPLIGGSVVVGPTANTIYTVTASDGTCSGVATVTLTTRVIPTISIVSSASVVCEGAPVTMTASGAISYSWTSPANTTGANITVNPSGPTLYSVIGTNSLNCTNTANQVVLTNPSPTVVITANKTLICPGDAVYLTAGGSGASSYAWTNGPGTAGYTVNPTAQTVYTVVGTGLGCSTTITITISVINASVNISASSNSICSGSSVVLTASGANSYVWTGYPTGPVINVTPLSTSVYTVTALTTSNSVNCSSTNNISITVFNSPNVTIAATKTVMCKSDAGPKLTASGAITYTWSTSANSSTVNVSPTVTNNTYSVSGTDANGCVNSSTIQIKINTCAGIDGITQASKLISVYPNPSNGAFTISSDAKLDLKLFNELGQELMQIKLSEQNDYHLSISNLANGIYFVSGQDANSRINQKIVITK